MTALENKNIVSVSWGDHLVFGEGDGRLASVAAVCRRMDRWQAELGAAIIHWRVPRSRIKGKFFQARGYRHFARSNATRVDWDDFRQIPQCAHSRGMKVFLYVSLFDEGWPLLPKKIRQVSYHNQMHGRHVSWQSDFSRQHPEYSVVDRSRKNHQWGILCLAYPQVRRRFINRFQRLLAAGDFDGLFVCLRSQSRPADFADQFGFNRPVRDEYLKRFGRDIWHEDFDLQRWRDLQGDYLTVFLAKLKKQLNRRGLLLAVGAARGNVLGPPLGNISLQWERWVQQGIVDQLIIDQDSSRCPSMGHDLWPMHRGYGYLQNYIGGLHMNSLEEDLQRVYRPVIQQGDTRLYLARQWHPRAPEKERALLKDAWVTGLVFSSFRHDNPGPVRRNDWRA